ncbi:hypothetical protein ABIF83_001850 [Bradyrhizobium ottawaense]
MPKMMKVVDLALVLRLHPLVGIEGVVGAVAAHDRASVFGLKIGDIEALDPARTALAVEDALPGRFDPAAEWRHHAETSDDNPPHIRKLRIERFTANNKKPADRWEAARPVSMLSPRNEEP